MKKILIGALTAGLAVMMIFSGCGGSNQSASAEKETKAEV
jgi:hypothetical protein